MSLIFESPAVKQDPGSTATHVLLIGCGEYPHLANAGFGGLKPLTSPRLSIEAMANWFLSGPDGMPEGKARPPSHAFYNPEAPLGSLIMLTSPAQQYQAPSGKNFPTTLPSIANIRKAYLEWLDRLGTNSNSRGVFHFCGHGVSNGISQYLVADDFGHQSENPWAGVFHVSNTCQATIRRTAASLFFLIDACMELSEELLNQIDDPNALIQGKRKGQPLTTEWAVLRATTANRLAYAPLHSVACFTAAFLQALGGHCGRQRPDGSGFDVGISDLRDATADFLTLSQQTGTNEQQKLGQTEGEGNWKLAMHVLNKRPSVLLEMDVQPEGYRPVARAFIENSTEQRDLKPLANGPVRFIKEHGEWTFGTNAQNNEYAEQSQVRQLLTRAVHTCRFRIP